MDLEKGVFKFAIDRGGTFTDIWSKRPDGSVRVLKLLSEDPGNYADAPREGIRRIISEYATENGCDVIPSGSTIDGSRIDWIRMGTTVATNALLERKGERMALVITKGFRDLIYIGNQSRPDLFDLEIKMPDVLYESVVEVNERIVPVQAKCQLPQHPGSRTRVGTTGEQVEVWEEVDVEALRMDLQTVYDRGIRSVAVVLMHSYMFPEHEKIVGRVAEEMGFTQVSLSSSLMPMVRAVPRGFTACADAYLTPKIREYIHGFSGGFKNGLDGINVLFMQSDGGLTPVSKFSGAQAILSGPAGGMVGYALTTHSMGARGETLPVIGFDMGGTSTDVSRYAGSLEHVMESTTAGVTIQSPQLDINTVAAGGGSRLFFRSGLFVVGPDSVGAHPGPVCYRKGGHLAITDANLVLGRILPEHFPSIFGPNQDEPLDAVASRKAFDLLAVEVNNYLLTAENVTKRSMTVEEVALGFIQVANETMCRPIRALTQGKGYDTAKHVLACFGGAGGQHACSIARSLGMSQVYIHRHSGILSAYGMALADVVVEAQEPCSLVYEQVHFSELDSAITKLKEKTREDLESQGFSEDTIETEIYLHLRYDRTDCALMVTPATHSTSSVETIVSPRHGDFLQTFVDRYQREFGFNLHGRKVLVDDVRVRGLGKTRLAEEIDGTGPTVLSEDELSGDGERKSDWAKPLKSHPCFFEGGERITDIYLLNSLSCGQKLRGPAVIIGANSTVLVEPHCSAVMTQTGSMEIEIGTGGVACRSGVGTNLDTIQLSIFSHRFMSIAEQMGRVLQRTSVSTNIKERLDFSCAMFGPDGGLVANAPHIPVHLGAMQTTIQYQIDKLGEKIKEGDVILSNHPTAGGSHLPDLTVITPVFYPGTPRPVFYVASRGHHADIGGITPGSMPPHSVSIDEEGAYFKSFKLVEGGVFKEKEVTDELMKPGEFPGNSGTRNLADNLSDLKAQVAANQKGIALVQELIGEYGLDVVQAYMLHIRTNAEVAVREMLKQTAQRLASSGDDKVAILSSSDFMDGGTEIRLKVTITKLDGSSVFDFTGTGPEVYGNCNAPRAVTVSALIYCLRCLVGHDLPLNQGCLRPTRLVIPKGSIIDPSDTAAVVGGNVLTSQRIVDVVLKAFGTCAASQGCMNNVTFGDEDGGYYETVAGGAGAGPTWHGRSGVHTHMTNTRITDPEIVERRYPVVVKEFSLRSGTGGKGRSRGGDGVKRSLLFRKDMTLSVLTERRSRRPYGLEGGEDGQMGLNLVQYADGRIVNVGSKASIQLRPGDTFLLQTPGGGGYGDTDDLDDKTLTTPPVKRARHNLHGSVDQYRRLQESA